MSAAAKPSKRLVSRDDFNYYMELGQRIDACRTEKEEREIRAKFREKHDGAIFVNARPHVRQMSEKWRKAWEDRQRKSRRKARRGNLRAV